MATTAQTLEVKQTRTPASGLIVAAVLALAGIAAWIYQLSAGMRVTGLGQQVVWGLYIAAFFTAIGAGAALLALAGLSEFRPVLPTAARPLALALALAVFVAGALLITLDVGNPIQLWRVIAGFRFSSMMTFDFWLLLVAGLVTLVYLLAARSGRPQKALGALAILAAVAVVAIEGWMLTTLAARPLWDTGMILVSFLVGAAIAGLGLAALLLPGAERVRPFLAAALAFALLLAVAEVLTGMLSGEPRTVEETRRLLTGSVAPIFWFHLLAGLLLPLFLLRGGSLPLAGGLAVLGVLAEKVWTLAAGQAQPWLDLPVGSYFPTWVEFVAVTGIVALAWLIYTGVKRLATEPRKA